MWDTLYEILFNPNHEMPLGVLIGIPIAAVLFNCFMPRYARHKVQQKRFDKALGRTQKNKRCTVKNKRRTACIGAVRRCLLFGF